MKKTLSVALLAVLIFTGLRLYQHNQLQAPMNEVLAADSRNSGIKVDVSYDGWLPSKTIVYNLREFSGSSQLDVFRVLMQYAVKKKDTRFERVYLAHQGQKKFLLSGDFFQKTGQEFEGENPVYVIRTFPENVFNLDGERAFTQWSGGVLGVLAKQTEDFAEFNRRWYLR